jgi:hypothetical protein
MTGASYSSSAFRCKDCFATHALCRECIVQVHTSNPLHVIEVRLYRRLNFSLIVPFQGWNGFYWQRSSLLKQGLRIQLGHDGSKCPKPRTCKENFTLFHTNGAHQVHVIFCGCKGSKAMWIQCFRKRWWATTTKSPKTAFSFDFLDHFQSLNLQGKLTLYDYCNVICHLTDNTGNIAVIICLCLI